MKYRLSAILIFLTAAIVTAGAFHAFAGEPPAMRQAPPELSYVKGAILYEAVTDTVLLEKEADIQRAPASMTKVMTAILVLERNPGLEGKLAVPADAVSPTYCSWMGDDRLIAGEVISYQDCMQYMLIPSGNEAATTFAFVIGGTMENFVEMMNAKAAELGCENTNFKEPTGLGGLNHYTTPRDMLKIIQYAMTFPKFREIVGMESGTVPASNVREAGFAYETTNRILRPGDNPAYQSPYEQYMTGVKTGYTEEAGYCFSGCMEKDGLVFYSVVMGGEAVQRGDRWPLGDFLDTISLYDYASRFSARGPEPGTCGESVFSLLGGGRAALRVPEHARLLVQGGAEVTAACRVPPFSIWPVAEGDAVGTVTLTADGVSRTFDLEAAESRPLSAVSVLSIAAVFAAAGAIRFKRRQRRGKKREYDREPFDAAG